MSFQIPPDAVRVWRGFRQSTLSQDDFFQRLGQTFIPSTVQMQIKNGLDTYIPTIPCGMTDKPDIVPDETAVLFWNSQQTYHDGFNTLAGRTYTLTHGGCYTPESRADFPVLYENKIALNQCYYLIDAPADWMHGGVRHLVGGLAPGDTAQQFSELQTIISDIQARWSIAGAVVCIGAQYIVYWELGDGTDPGFDALQQACSWSHAFTPKATTLPPEAALWSDWHGMTVVPGDSYNMQFKRAFEA
ncbi:hypothetical protein GN278_08825 [Rhodobacteraceae bacterium Araon29]